MSNRSTYMTTLLASLAGITGVAAVGSGPDWPELPTKGSTGLPLLWIQIPDQTAEAIPQLYRLDDRLEVRVHRLDWSTDPSFDGAEQWIKKVVDKIETDPSISMAVQFIEYQNSKAVSRDFPICIESIEFKVIHHRTFTNL